MFAGPTNSQAVERKVNNRRGVERQHLADDQASDDRDAERTSQFRTGSSAQGERQGAEYGGHGGHQYGTKAQQAGLIDGVFRALFVDAFSGESEIDHQYAVLLNNANEQDNSNYRDNA